MYVIIWVLENSEFQYYYKISRLKNMSLFKNNFKYQNILWIIILVFKSGWFFPKNFYTLHIAWYQTIKNPSIFTASKGGDRQKTFLKMWSSTVIDTIYYTMKPPPNCTINSRHLKSV